MEFCRSPLFSVSEIYYYVVKIMNIYRLPIKCNLILQKLFARSKSQIKDDMFIGMKTFVRSSLKILLLNQDSVCAGSCNHWLETIKSSISDGSVIQKVPAAQFLVFIEEDSNNLPKGISSDDYLENINNPDQYILERIKEIYEDTKDSGTLKYSRAMTKLYGPYSLCKSKIDLKGLKNFFRFVALVLCGQLNLETDDPSKNYSYLSINWSKSKIITADEFKAILKRAIERFTYNDWIFYEE